MSDRLSWTFRICAVLVVLLALGLRLNRVRHLALGNDEVAEVRWSSGSFGEMMRIVAEDAVHPPLDYVVQFALKKMGVDEWVRRLPPVLFGTASVALVIYLGYAWVDRRAGLFAGLLMAVSPMHVRFSQEVRPYSMGLFSVVATLAALELFAVTRKRRWALAWFLGVMFAGYTFYFSGMVAGVTSLARIAVDRRDVLRPLWRRIPFIFIGWVVLYLPWLRVAVQAVRDRPHFAPDKLTWMWWQWRLLAFGTGEGIFMKLTLGSWAFWIAVVAGTLVSIRYPRLRVAVVWLFVCGAIELLALHYRPHYSAARHLMPAWVGAFILAGASLSIVSRKRITAPIAATVVVTFCVYCALTLADYYHGERPNWRIVAEYVYDRAHPGETVIFANPWVLRNFGYYWLRMPPREGITVELFKPYGAERFGPAWIVTGQCRPRPPLMKAGLMRKFPDTDIAEVRFVREGQSVATSEELCPE